MDRQDRQDATGEQKSGDFAVSDLCSIGLSLPRVPNGSRLNRSSKNVEEPIETFLGGKEDVIWIFAGIEVGKRLWPFTMVGSRSYQKYTLAIPVRFQM